VEKSASQFLYEIVPELHTLNRQLEELQSRPDENTSQAELCLARDLKEIGMLTGTGLNHHCVGSSPNVRWSESTVKLGRRMVGGAAQRICDVKSVKWMPKHNFFDFLLVQLKQLQDISV
jgi:hypothetical protein